MVVADPGVGLGDAPPLDPRSAVGDEDPSTERRRVSRVEILVPIRTLIVIAALVTVALLLVAARGLLFSIVVATVLSLGLDPAVGALVARGWSRPRAALFVFASLLAGVTLVVLVTIDPLWNEIRAFADHLPDYWNQLAANPTLKPLLSHVSQRSMDSDLSTLAKEVPRVATTVLGIAGSAFSSLLSVLTLTFLSLFLLMERPLITNWLFGFTRPQTEVRWRPVLDQSISAVAATLVGNVMISIVAGTVAGVAALALGLPFPIVLAVITGLLDLVPQLGATIAAVILVLAGLTISTPTAVAMLAIQLVYQQVENNFLYPIVFRRAVALSPLTTVLAVMVGASLLGVIGAIVAVPLAAIVKIVVHEAALPRRARMQHLRQPSLPDTRAEVAGPPPS
ncbi:MAG: AI-2E family transporter [Solirubrobacteraceae bacterium]